MWSGCWGSRLDGKGIVKKLNQLKNIELVLRVYVGLWQSRWVSEGLLGGCNSYNDEAGCNSCYDKAGRIGILLKILQPDPIHITFQS